MDVPAVPWQVGCCQLWTGTAVAGRGWDMDIGHPGLWQRWPKQPKGVNPAENGQTWLWDELNPAWTIRTGSRRNPGGGQGCCSATAATHLQKADFLLSP